MACSVCLAMAAVRSQRRRWAAHGFRGALRRCRARSTSTAGGKRRSGGRLPSDHQAQRRPASPRWKRAFWAEAVIVSIASTSAVCEIKSKQADLEVGDLAYLSPQDADVVRMLAASGDSHKYAQVVSFTEGDPSGRRSPQIRAASAAAGNQPAAGHVRRWSSHVTNDHGPAAASSTQEGVVFRADMTRINGTYWNFTGFYRGRLDPFGGNTVTDLDGSDQPHVHHRPVLQQSRIKVRDGCGAPISSMGHQPGYDRRRLHRAQS